jgi:fucose permease
MVGLFVPIFIWDKTDSIHWIFAYYLFFRFVGLIFSYPAALFMRKFGVDKTLMVGSILRIGHILSFILVTTNNNYLFLSAGFWGMTVVFDWIPFHYTISALAKEGSKFGKSSSVIDLIAKLGGAIGPFIGDIIPCL